MCCVLRHTCIYVAYMCMLILVCSSGPGVTGHCRSSQSTLFETGSLCCLLLMAFEILEMLLVHLSSQEHSDCRHDLLYLHLLGTCKCFSHCSICPVLTAILEQSLQGKYAQKAYELRWVLGPCFYVRDFLLVGR